MLRLGLFLLGIAAVVVFSLPALGATYFVSPLTNDANPGYFPMWVWGAGVQVDSAGLRPRDQVLVERSGTWRETLTQPTRNLFFGAFGSGPRPVISDADLFSSGWSNVN